MAQVEVNIDDAYMDMIERLKSDEVTTEQFISQVTENTVHNHYQRQKNSQPQE